MGKKYSGIKYCEDVNIIEKKIEALELEKVDKEEGKQLSDEDFTTRYKDYLDSVIERSGELRITQNGTYDVIGYSRVVVDIDNTDKLQFKTVYPSQQGELVTPDEGYIGLSQVNVVPVTSTIDSDIKPENIKSGVTILGVLGTYGAQ